MRRRRCDTWKRPECIQHEWEKREEKKKRKGGKKTYTYKRTRWKNGRTKIQTRKTYKYLFSFKEIFFSIRLQSLLSWHCSCRCCGKLLLYCTSAVALFQWHCYCFVDDNIFICLAVFCVVVVVVFFFFLYVNGLTSQEETIHLWNKHFSYANLTIWINGKSAACFNVFQLINK